MAEIQAARAHNERNPILMFPVEVTCEIFTFAWLPSREDTDEGYDRFYHCYAGDLADWNETQKESKFPSEVVITHVCQRWRSIALDLPKLWTTIYYGFRARYLSGSPTHMLDVYVGRSSDLPLSFWFDFRQDPCNPYHGLLVAQAVQYVSRWRLMAIYGWDFDMMEPIYDLRDVSAPLLEWLTIAPGQHEDEMTTELIPQIFRGGAPKLTYLMLDGSLIRDALPPVSNLTILRIEKDEWDDHHDHDDSEDEDMDAFYGLQFFLNLISLPALTQLSLAGYFIYIDDPLPVIDMPNLERLRLGRFDAAWELLLSMRAPRLETLVLVRCGFLNTGSPLQHVFPALRKLYVIEGAFKRSIAPDFTRLTSQATEVVLSESFHVPSSRSLLQMILAGCYATEVWPGMTKMLYNIKGHEHNVDPYTDFSIFRRRSSFTLYLATAFIESLYGEVGLEELMLPSFIKLRSRWELDEPFWPTDLELGANCKFERGDGFEM